MSSSVQRTTVRSLSRSTCIGRRATSVRSLSTANQVPPESPDYIHVPQPKQAYRPNKPIVKGVLPTPKRLFKPFGAGRSRATDGYFANTIPERKTERPEPVGKDKEFVEYKMRMTELRRSSLRDGLIQLKERHEETVKQTERRFANQAKRHQEAIDKPERLDDKLTSPTILPTVQNMVTAPMTEQQIAEKRARFEAKEWAKLEERRTNLHTLYMNARDFIVTEDQLNAKINEVFDDPFWQNENDPSIWGKEGEPERLQDIITRQSIGSTVAKETYTNITRERLQAIAEELTGGKMENQARLDQRAGRESY